MAISGLYQRTATTTAYERILLQNSVFAVGSRNLAAWSSSQKIWLGGRPLDQFLAV
jgi:hypothetical protein